MIEDISVFVNSWSLFLFTYYDSLSDIRQPTNHNEKIKFFSYLACIITEYDESWCTIMGKL